MKPRGGASRIACNPMARRRLPLGGLSWAIRPFLILALALPAHAQPLCICLRCVLLTHDSFYAPSSNMEPTLPPNTCFEGRYLQDGEPVPAPGSVVTFSHPVTGIDFVKRIVATEGQTVQLIDGHLHIDGVAVDLAPMADYERVFEDTGTGLPRCRNAPVGLGGLCLNTRLQEMLQNGVSYAILDTQSDGAADDTELMTVPPGHVFVLGDNRDNSVDSRFAQRMGGIGMVPVETLRTIVDSPATQFE